MVVVCGWKNWRKGVVRSIRRLMILLNTEKAGIGSNVDHNISTRVPGR